MNFVNNYLRPDPSKTHKLFSMGTLNLDSEIAGLCWIQYCLAAFIHVFPGGLTFAVRIEHRIIENPGLRVQRNEELDNQVVEEPDGGTDDESGSESSGTEYTPAASSDDEDYSDEDESGDSSDDDDSDNDSNGATGGRTWTEEELDISLTISNT